MLRLLLIVFTFTIVVGCQSSDDGNQIANPQSKDISVRVINETGQPVEGAEVFVWVNEESYVRSDIERTNSFGLAVFDERFINGEVMVEAHDFISIKSILRPDSIYVVTHTSRRTRQIGVLASGRWFFHRDYVISINYDGRYQCVQVDSNGFHQGTNIQLISEGEIYSRLINDETLWVLSEGDGAVKIDISEPLNPIVQTRYQVFHGDQTIYVATDSLLITGYHTYSENFVEIYRIYEDESIRWLSRLDLQRSLPEVGLYGNQLLISHGLSLSSYDISNPSAPSLTSTRVYSYSGLAHFFEDSVVVVTDSDDPDKSYLESFDLANPAFPVALTRRTVAFNFIYDIAGPGMVIANSGHTTICLAEMTGIDSVFQVTATIMSSSSSDVQYPMVLTGTRVWWIE